MSKITTTTNAARPVSPPAGTLLYETDTNKLLFFDGTIYHVYDRDSIAYPTGGEDELHYASGIYSDSSATYYITTAPQCHFDSLYIDGSTHPTGNRQIGTYTHETLNGWLTRPGSTYQTNGGDASFNTVYNDTEKSVDFYGTGIQITLTNNITVTDDYTYFLVSGSTDKQINGLTELLPSGPRVAGNASQLLFHAGNGSGAYALLAGHAMTASNFDDAIPNSGDPSLFISRRSSDVNRYWGMSHTGYWPDLSGNTSTRRAHLEEVTESKSFNLTGMGRYYTDYFGGDIYEVILFDTALSQSDMDLVHTYLLNKYSGKLDHVQNDGTLDKVDILDPLTYNMIAV